MQAGIKFCGLTRPEDAREAASLGAAYLGVIFAPSQRRVTVPGAQALFAAVNQLLEVGAERGERDASPRVAAVGQAIGDIKARPQRAGVFAQLPVREIADVAAALSLDVIQLHEAVTEEEVAFLRTATGCRIWSVVRVGAVGISPEALVAARHADAILFDSKVEGQLGGTGRVFDWAAARDAVAPLRGTRPVILAGGLHPANVAAAIATFRPDVVDVSSGVESAPGIKDHARMRAFADAVRGVHEE